MVRRKAEESESNEILTPVSLNSDVDENEIKSEDEVKSEDEKKVEDDSKKEDEVKTEKIQEVNINAFNSESYSFLFDNQNFSNSFLERNSKMINSVNPINQTVQPTANVIFTGNNVRTNSCNGCCGWLNHNNNSGIFTLTKAGIYRIHFNTNVAPTVAGAITLNITNAGENISGGEMRTAGTTVGTFENVSADILVRVPCNSSVVLTIKNNTPTNPITISQPSLIITREA